MSEPLPIIIPGEHMKEVPNLWSITRSSGKSTLVAAETELKALAKYERVASLLTDLGQKLDPVESVHSVACIK